MGFFGLGFALALLYATMRADRRQHRGLSLASMAVGLASFLWILFFLFDPISTFQYKRERHHRVRRLHRPAGRADLDRGSFLLAKEPEGDVEEDAAHRTSETHARPVQTTRLAEVTEARPANVTGRDVVERHPTDTRYTGGTDYTSGTEHVTGTSDVHRTDYVDDVTRGSGTRRGDEPGTF